MIEDDQKLSRGQSPRFLSVEIELFAFGESPKELVGVERELKGEDLFGKAARGHIRVAADR